MVVLKERHINIAWVSSLKRSREKDILYRNNTVSIVKVEKLWKGEEHVASLFVFEHPVNNPG